MVDGKVNIRKGFLKEEEFEKAYLEAADKYAADSPSLIHMRIRTSGTVSAKNCHPFKIKGGAMIHNGIMFTPTGERAGTPKDLKSDTRVFTEALYNVLALEDVKRAAKGITEAIGWGNKLAFLYDDKETYIINEDAGTWDNGIWFSNNSCAASSWRRFV